MPPKPTPLPDFTAITIKAFAQSLPMLFDLFVVKLWWLWPTLLLLAYLRAKLDRKEKLQKTERRLRDEAAIKEKLRREGVWKD